MLWFFILLLVFFLLGMVGFTFSNNNSLSSTFFFFVSASFSLFIIISNAWLGSFALGIYSFLTIAIFLLSRSIREGFLREKKSYYLEKTPFFLTTLFFFFFGLLTKIFDRYIGLKIPQDIRGEDSEWISKLFEQNIIALLGVMLIFFMLVVGVSSTVVALREKK